MTAPAGNAEDAVSQWVTFSLGDETYGVNVMKVQEVLRVGEVAPVPGAPPFVIGIVNLRGAVVTVVDARLRFGLPAREADDASRIVIIEADDMVAGMLVDSVAEVVEVAASRIESAPNVGNDDGAHYIHGVVSTDDGLLILVDLDKLLAPGEWEEMGGR